ncbi:hypothetical protein CANARDRAFT_7623 [[Candida] arabinofermentans NRRL YB-2248]|uniref:SUI1 domain-containing protein n=1 Tax=[Candida] arabinofermentans NRRL YB-2248 TaxID=983967 RepID=A0A1E4T1B5_9ASCO|nr:hypothetical protein CANARDRAFT_7623 [[Candida] arabinofermentans NRRL YB-2248]
MFKKSPGLKSLSNVKSSEKRRLYYAICNDYNLPQSKLSPELSKLILPNNIKYATFKSATGVQGTIYTDERNTPIWFKTRDSDMLLPTVFTLWKCPFILPIIYTHNFVIERLLNGSNLMIPGTLPPFDKRLQKGKFIAIANINDPKVVIAVGYCQADIYKLDQVVGVHGVAVDIVHIVQDELFGMVKGNVKVPTNDDIELDTVLSIEDSEPEQTDITSNVEESAKEEQANVTSNAEEIVKEEEPVKVEEPQVKVQNNDEDLANDIYQLKIQDIDDFFIRSLLYSITQDKIEVPIQASNFMSNHILKNLPQVDTNLVNMKKTSWKKTAKFLKSMEKSQLIKVKGKDDDLTIVSLADRTNDQVAKFEPYKIKKQQQNSSTGSTATTSNNDNGKLIILELYKPQSSSRMFFNSLDLKYDTYYTLQELKTLILEYIQKNQLGDLKNPKNIRPDDIMRQMLKIEKPTIERSKVLETALKNSFSKFWKILQNMDDYNKVKPRKGDLPKVKIIEEMKLGRKIVTRVIGMEEYWVDPDELSSILRVKCSGSTTVTKNIQNPSQMEVTVQGPHNKLVQDLLATEYGVKPTWIEYENKVKKKSKKPKPVVV